MICLSLVQQIPGGKNGICRHYVMSDYVFDSFALTAYVLEEPGKARVSELIEEGRAGSSRLLMTTVNLGETLYITERRHGAPSAAVYVLNLFADLPIELVDADRFLTIAAARIKAVTPISFGDCFAAALALQRTATVVTGDWEFQRVEHIVPIEWLPRAR